MHGDRVLLVKNRPKTTFVNYRRPGGCVAGLLNDEPIRFYVLGVKASMANAGLRRQCITSSRCGSYSVHAAVLLVGGHEHGLGQNGGFVVPAMPSSHNISTNGTVAHLNHTAAFWTWHVRGCRLLHHPAYHPLRVRLDILPFTDRYI